AKHVIDYGRRLLDDKASHDIGVRRDELECSHRTGGRQPGRETSLSIIEGYYGTILGLSIDLFHLGYEVLQARQSELVEGGRQVPVAAARLPCGETPRDDFFKIGGNQKAGTFAVNLREPSVKRTCRERIGSRIRHCSRECRQDSQTGRSRDEI